MATEFGCFFEDALYGGGFGVEHWKGHDLPEVGRSSRVGE